MRLTDYCTSVLLLILAGCREGEAPVSGPGNLPKGDLVIRARLDATSAAPDPKTVPYPDCLITARFSTLEVLAGKFEEDAVLASFWAFRKWRSTGAESLGVGDTVVLSLADTDSNPAFAASMRIDDTGDFLSTHFVAVDWKLEKKGAQISGSEAAASENPLPRVSTETVPDLNQALLNHGQECVEGGDGFFFYLLSREIYRPGFWELPEGARFANGAVGAVPAILDFHRELTDLGIPLCIVIVPRSSSVFPDLATGLPFDPESDRPVNFPVEDFAVELRRNGIPVLNLTPKFIANRWVSVSEGRREPVCLPNDDHWSPAGAKLAAASVAEFLSEEISLAGLLSPNPTAYEKIEIADHEIQVSGGFQRFFRANGRLQPVTATAFRVKGKPGESGSGDTKKRPVVIGDSYLKIFSKNDASFIEHLEVALKQQPAVIASNGGITTSRQIFAREVDPDRVSFVVWEFAEDFIALHQGWRKVPLKVGGETLAFAGSELLAKARDSGPGWVIVSDEMFGFAEKSLRFEFSDGEDQEASIKWEDVHLGDQPVFSATLSIGPAVRKPGDARTKLAFELWFDGELLATRSLEAHDTRTVWLRDWEIPMNSHGRRTGTVEIRCVNAGRTPVAFAALRNPELRNSSIDAN